MEPGALGDAVIIFVSFTYIRWRRSGFLCTMFINFPVWIKTQQKTYLQIWRCCIYCYTYKFIHRSVSFARM